jgi:hypothetical protein
VFTHNKTVRYPNGMGQSERFVSEFRTMTNSLPDVHSGTTLAWENFRDELFAFMEWRDLQPADLAKRIALIANPIDSGRIRQWRAGNGRPQFDELPVIVEALAMNEESAAHYADWKARGKPSDQPGLAEQRAFGTPDWTYLVVRMGMVPSMNRAEGVRLATKLSTLQSRVQKASEELSQHSLDQGAAQLVRAVTASAEWAIAIWPAVEGFVDRRVDGTMLDARLHVADRVDFRRVDGKPATKAAVWDSFEDQLKAARAIATLPGGERWPSSKGDRASVSNWSIRRLGAPHASEIDYSYPNLHSVAVTSLSVGSWANDVADHISRLIGYGFTSSRDIATDLYGLTDPGAFGESRSLIHRDFLRGGLMLKRVWGHFSTSEMALPELLGGPSGSKTFTVYLKEHDADLEVEARRLVKWEKDRRKDAFASSTEFLPHNYDEILTLLHDRRAAVDVLLDDPERENVIKLDLGEHRDEMRREGKFRECFEIAAATVYSWITTERISREELSPYWDKVERRIAQRPSPGLVHARAIIDYFKETEGARIREAKEKGR